VGTMHRRTGSPLAMAACGAHAWAGSFQSSSYALGARPGAVHTLPAVKNGGIVRSLGLAGDGSG